jgi:hypothetical protein
MSEQPAGRDVLVGTDRDYGIDVLLGPLYADVEMAHATTLPILGTPVCRFLDVYKYTRV